MAQPERGLKKSQSLKQRMQTVLDEDGEELKDIYHEVTASDIISQAHKAHKTMRNAYDGIGGTVPVAKQARGNHGSQGEEHPAPDPSVLALAPVELQQHSRSSVVYYAKLPSATALMLNKDKDRTAMGATGSSATSSDRRSCNWSGTHHGVPMSLPFKSVDPLLAEDSEDDDMPTPSLSNVVLSRPPTEVGEMGRPFVSSTDTDSDPAEDDCCDVRDEPLSSTENIASRGLPSGDHAVPSPRLLPSGGASFRSQSFRSQSFRSQSFSQAYDDDEDDDDGGWGPPPDGEIMGGDSLFLSGAAEQALNLLRGALQRSPSKSSLASSSSLRRLPSSNAMLGRKSCDVQKEFREQCAAKSRRGSIDLSHMQAGIQTGSPGRLEAQPRQPGARRGSVDLSQMQTGMQAGIPGRQPGARRGSVDLSQMQTGMQAGIPGRQPGARRGSVDLSHVGDGGTPRASKSVDLSLAERPRTITLPAINSASSPRSRRTSIASPGTPCSGTVRFDAPCLVSSQITSPSSTVRFDAPSEHIQQSQSGSLEQPEPPLCSPSKVDRGPSIKRSASRLSVVAFSQEEEEKLMQMAGFGLDPNSSDTSGLMSPHPLGTSTRLGTPSARPRSRSCMAAVVTAGGGEANPFSGGSAPLPPLSHVAMMSGQQALSGSTHSSGGFSRQLTAESVEEEGVEGGYLAPSCKAPIWADPCSGSSMGFRSGSPVGPDPCRASAMGSFAPMQMRPRGGSLGGPDPRNASAMGSLASQHPRATGGSLGGSLAPMQTRPCGGSLGGREHFRSASTQPPAAMMDRSKSIGPKDKVVAGIQRLQTLDRPNNMAGSSPRSASCTPGATAGQGATSSPTPPKGDMTLQQRLAKYNRPRMAPTPDALFSG